MSVPEKESSDSSTFPDVVAASEEALTTVKQIPVHISYEIIRLFSEGLYQSPQKAVEELVSNSYDANASQAHVLLPDSNYQPVDPREIETEATAGDAAGQEATEAATGDDEDVDPDDLPPLWVIDNGHGLDETGFEQLWRVADSRKAGVDDGPRPPIGQFGIGKLAAYVLAWRLTHISKVDGKILLTSMNFKRLEGVHQYDNTSPLDLDLKEISVEEAKRLMTDIEARDEKAWEMLFGVDASATWTAARLSDFKDLYKKLSSGRLDWVLRSGLPLHSEFKIWLNGSQLESSKAAHKRIFKFTIGGEEDNIAEGIGFTKIEGGISIPDIGSVFGKAEVFEKRLTKGKSDQYGRSHGFFVRVRKRVINLDDELFGLDVLNHATWARFAMDVDADGLRDHLLSSREGVRENEATENLKHYFLQIFNRCRNAYDKHVDLEQNGIDIKKLMQAAPSAYMTEPVIESVRIAMSSGMESYYVASPTYKEGQTPDAWFAEYATAAETELLSDVVFEDTGEFDRAVRYYPSTRRLVVNSEHPFVNKLLESGRGRAPAALFGSSEFLIDALLQDYGLSRQTAINLLSDRDKVLRLVAGDEPSTAAEALRLLKSALTHETALERAVGTAFRVLGFEYERRGGNAGGADGVLYARLGRGSGTGVDDYRIVYDAKQTNGVSVPADKIDFSSLEAFRVTESANFGFFIAKKYDGQDTPTTKINQKLNTSRDAGQKLGLLLVEQLQRLVELHYKFGVTLTKVRDLFAVSRTTSEVTAWLDELEADLMAEGRRVPVLTLLETLEELKADSLQVPSVKVARYKNDRFMKYSPEELSASLRAVATIVGGRWIEVNEANDEVRLHTTAGQIVAEVERNLRDIFGEGIDALERPEITG